MRRWTEKGGFTAYLVAVSLAALASAGCQFYHYSEKKLYGPGERASEADTDTPHVTVDMANSAQLRAVPLQVQHAFAQDYGSAAVTSVQMQPTGTGAMFYKIGYIENGTPGQAVYHADGQSAVASGGTVILPEPSLVPITPLPAEPTTTAPTGPTSRDFQ